MPLQRVAIEQLVGVDRNSAEGAGQAPSEVSGLTFDRRGGLVTLGVLSDEYSEIATSAGVIAYDEAGMVLLAATGGSGSVPAILDGPNLVPLDADEFSAESPVLATRAAALAPFRRSVNGFSGRVLSRSPSGEFVAHPVAPGITITLGGAGSAVPADTYDIIYSLEAPTDAGMVTYAAGVAQQVVGSGVDGLTFGLGSVIPAGHVVRMYYRRASFSSLGFSRFAVAVSDGESAVESVFSDVAADDSEFLVSEDAILNFGGVRTEPHEGRMWGVATSRPFVPFTPDPTTVVDAYFTRLGPTVAERVFLSATVASARQPFVLEDSTISFDLRGLQVVRLVSGQPVNMPLITMISNTNSAVAMVMSLEFGSGSPGVASAATLRVDLLDGLTSVPDRTWSMPVPTGVIPALGHEAGLTSESKAHRFTAEITNASLASGFYQVYILLSVKSLGNDILASSSVYGIATEAVWDKWVATSSATVRLGARGFGWYEVATSSGTIEWTDSVGTTNGTNISFSALVRDWSLDPPDLSWLSLAAGGELWTVRAGAAVVAFADAEVSAGALLTQPATTVVFSHVGTVNRGTQDHYVILTPASSTRITGLASTPAGLLVFMQNEAWLLSGNPDPVTGSLQVQRFSGTLGNDVGVIPGRLGAVVFPIYKGEIYAVNLGMGDVDFGQGMENISLPVRDRHDPFVQVVGEPQKNHVVARTASGHVYRYDAQVKQWVNDVADAIPLGDLSAEPALLVEEGSQRLLEDGGRRLTEEATRESRLMLLPSEVGSPFGTRYFVNASLQAADFSVGADAAIEWSDVDLGDKQQAKLWRRLEVATSDLYVGPPTLTYRTRGGAVTVVGVKSGRGRWSLSFRRGEVAAKADLRLDLAGMSTEDVLEAPVVIEFVPRNRSRGRVA